jgi:hypothetical protein
MDCFRSVFDGPLGAAALPESLDGLAGGAGALPKKSSPRRDSDGLVCFGGCVPIGGPVDGLAGAEISSPNRSMAGLCGALDAVACVWESDRSTAGF